MDYTTFLTSVVILVSSYSTIRFLQHRKRSRNHPFPPGPEGYPIIGNVLSLFQGERWKIFSDYKKQYGDLVRLHGFGTDLIALNSLDAIDDLLGKRGHIYSHRPTFTVVGEMMGLDQSTPLQSYGPDWRMHRKLAHNVLSITVVKQYCQLQEDLAVLLCDEFIKTPEKFFSSTRLFASRLMLTITYGLSAKDADNLYVEHAHKTMAMVSRSSIPGAFIADFLPFLKHVPWPSFRKEVEEGRDMIDGLVRLPFEHVKRDIAAGTALPSLTKDLLTTSDPSLDHHIKWTTGSMYGAGGESTYATVSTFILCMVLYPEVQRKAQEEVDRVIGKGRLPLIEDMPDLPYVNAMIKETMRWHPIVPLTLARRVAEDDYYKGFFIPKGTLVIPNAWAIALESNPKYEPSEFIPERFLDKDVKATDPALWAFGFGRRICPGKHLAENSLFIAISMILTVFNISKGDHEVTAAFEEDLISYPKPFKCKIEPRSDLIKKLVTTRAAEVYV
ncbi:Cytochrome P450 monooxygenase 74 [Psilocybe cubensis]|uniref:Cytochrome P450 n=2 Tax=Psilocybe cubensis TaxID=181762 RepID=A0A8H7XIZ2_PSICU|nr:Cytochrome P450 monooxygenase 74 [Psilocybe cubensis]KAH9483265.1 Cytochrome P450 monooxygenase 74 [Psilocybe cubensis]